MSRAILITQCLQDDFVKPIGRNDPLPNLLHIGFEESRRLMGEKPSEGPVIQVIRWAYGRDDRLLQVIHIRDWHDPNDPLQASHLAQFGPHCVKESEGARFVFQEIPVGEKRIPIVDSLTLNDFDGTDLAEILGPFARLAGRARVGLMGVWTEAKITFLAYELRTRYPDFEIAVCSALTAGSSRSHHFMALDQLERILGVRVFSSVGEFTAFLGGDGVTILLPGSNTAEHPRVRLEDAPSLPEPDLSLVRYLFRDSRDVHLRSLQGGFSGNAVLLSESIDLYGQEQAPHVVKIGPLGSIGQERTAFERIESVLGNNAPRVADFADLGERGGIKYRYAAMGSGSSATFQRLYRDGLPPDRIRTILSAVFQEQLGRFYRAAVREKCNLLKDYGFDLPGLAGRVRRKVSAVLGTFRFPNGRELANLGVFYADQLPDLLRRAEGSRYRSWVHGDLNAANIIIDSNGNVWLIDFSHARRGHVLQDLIKFENDLLYILTPLQDEEELADALRLTDLLVEARDLASPLTDLPPGTFGSPHLHRAYETVRLLRLFYQDLLHEDTDPLQLWIGLLRYAVHTLSFEEPTLRQKRWALYTASRCAELIAAAFASPAGALVSATESGAL